MSYPDLSSFVKDLEAHGELVRIKEEIDPNLEVTVIQHRVLAKKGPALLFENVKNSPFKLVTNLYGTKKRVEKVFGSHPGEIGEKLVSLAELMMKPSVSNIWSAREDIFKVAKARIKKVRTGPILTHEISKPKLTQLPCLTCWPKDGGAFFTLPLVHTVDPETNVGNLGIYRLQRFSDTTTGMHWQIGKGGGFHFQRACELNKPLPVSVIIGGPPALTLAAIAPLPEGIDERLLAALIMGKSLEVIIRNTTGHTIPAKADFVLEGTVNDNDLQREGPFGDHLGHYSHSADFPVFRVEKLLIRNNPIFPATVVGKPPQEDFYIGMALQEMTLPLFKLMNPGIIDLWAYPETGFHPLAVASVKERYPKEALKQAFAIMGFGQLSLTKILIITNGDCDDVKDFRKVSRSIWKYLDAQDGIHLIAPTAQDTLDFTGPAMNTGSRLILLATKKSNRSARHKPPPATPKKLKIHKDIIDCTNIGEAFLIVQVNKTFDFGSVREALLHNEITKQYLFHVFVSPDVPLNEPMLILWGWFTRFDPLVDIHPYKKKIEGNRIVFEFPITIDATWKEGYRLPVEFDPDTVKKVDAKWDKLKL